MISHVIIMYKWFLREELEHEILDPPNNIGKIFKPTHRHPNGSVLLSLSSNCIIL